MDKDFLSMSPFHILASHELGSVESNVNDHKHMHQGSPQHICTVSQCLPNFLTGNDFL